MTKKEILQNTTFFAPGIPYHKGTAEIPITEDKKWEFAIQKHLADRAGLHYDIRLGNPESGIGHSFVVRTLPKSGEKILANHTIDHVIPYFDFKGRINKGYGKGVVRRVVRGQVNIKSSSPDKITFITRDKQPKKYSLIRTDGKKWLMLQSDLEKQATSILKKKLFNISDKSYNKVLNDLKEKKVPIKYTPYENEAFLKWRSDKRNLKPSIEMSRNLKDTPEGRAYLLHEYGHFLNLPEQIDLIRKRNKSKNLIVNSYINTLFEQNANKKVMENLPFLDKLRYRKFLKKEFRSYVEPYKHISEEKYNKPNKENFIKKLDDTAKSLDMTSEASTFLKTKTAEDIQSAKAKTLEYLKKIRPYAYKAKIVGSISRGHEDVGDADLVVWPKKNFRENVYLNKQTSGGEKMLRTEYKGLPINIWLADKKSFEPTKYHFSRGKGIIHDKIKAREKGMRLTRYGLQDGDKVYTKEKKIKELLKK